MLVMMENRPLRQTGRRLFDINKYAIGGTPQPPPVRSRKNGMRQRRIAVQHGANLARLRKNGYEPAFGGGKAVMELVRRDLARWGRMAGDAKIPKE
jgi:hypothetical protein